MNKISAFSMETGSARALCQDTLESEAKKIKRLNENMLVRYLAQSLSCSKYTINVYLNILGDKMVKHELDNNAASLENETLDLNF